MLLNQETIEVRDRALLESIKSDIQSHLNEIGITTSNIIVEMSSKSIVLNIGIQCLSHNIKQHQFDGNL
ncbi:hypothetical protein EHE19_007590 [Ruminiclostridium herbifermentans]|uniref:Uncharacterized protein n=1 Tax=Ruminiclostridium herbifermentans TaxID=2488810 RepID=A0A4U7JJZ2_9FIRM|nr:hypothetical protein [Ruminiclostridium herbifermentans]QNU68265.1 hypothetical protein EHE19_007590 [Ruminiclostridium herbifermentans]